MMNFFIEWLETSKSVFTSPSKHFQQERRLDGFGYPLKFATISIAVASVLALFRGVLAGLTLPSVAFNPLSLVTGLLQTLVIAAISYLAIAAIIHVFVYLFGGRGFRKTLAAVEYASVVAPIASALSFLSVFGMMAGVNILGTVVGLLVLIAGLWALQIEYRGIQHFHGLSTFKAGMTITLPIVILAVMAIGTVVLAQAALMAAIGV